jgi:hypothetical protein
MAGVNTAAAGGPVGGGNMMMMMPDAQQQNQINQNFELHKTQLNTYIYEYFLRTGLTDVARTLVSKGDKFKIKEVPKQSPGRRKDGDANGAADSMDIDTKLEVPDDLPQPSVPESNSPGQGFLMEWFSIFSDIYMAARKPERRNNGPAEQYLMHAQVSVLHVLHRRRH